MALGGAGITLADLVRRSMRRCRNGGEVAPLRYPAGRPARPRAAAIFGPLAAWYVNDILAEAPPPPGVLPAEVRRGRRLAFKTGTSYGYRDFWAVGYDAEVTIGGVGGPARRHADAGPQRPAHRGAGPVQDRRPARPGAAAQRAAAAARERCWSAAASCRRALQRLDRRRRRRGPHAMPAARRSSIRRTARGRWDGAEVPLEAAGGSGRCAGWSTAGRSPQPPRGTLYWRPEGIGFAQLTVIDAEGRSARATVRLAP